MAWEEFYDRQVTQPPRHIPTYSAKVGATHCKYGIFVTANYPLATDGVWFLDIMMQKDDQSFSGASVVNM